MFETKIRLKLEEARNRSLYRKPLTISSRKGKYIKINNKNVLNFASNDYLGIGDNKQIKKIISDRLEQFSNSSSSSRLVSGNYLVTNETENELAEYFGFEDCLLFSSGYLANLALVSSIFDKNDTVFYDKKIHASLAKGMSLSEAEFLSFKHNSFDHLLRRFSKKQTSNIALITESLFSMDGDIPDFTQLKELKSKHSIFTIIDEAHSVGVLGDKGRGLSGNVADIMIGTFGKAFGLWGAFVLLSSKLKEYLLNFASPQIYSTTFSPAIAASIIDILKIIKNKDLEREHLKNISELLKSELIESGFKVNGDAHILSVFIGKEEEAIEIRDTLIKNGFMVLAARYPTVGINKAIIRISLTSEHTKEDAFSLIKTLKGLKL